MSTELALRSEAILPVSKDIYFSCTRAERKNVARELAEYRAIKAQALETLDKLIETHIAFVRLTAELGLTFSAETIVNMSDKFRSQALLLIDLSPSHPPLRLLACADCGYLVPECHCLDGEGKPLDWGANN